MNGGFVILALGNRTSNSRNFNLEISSACTKTKLQEPAYSQILSQDKVGGKEVKMQRGRQADS